MNRNSPEKIETLKARPAAYAVRLNKTPEEWTVGAGSWRGAQVLGRGTTEQEVWKTAAKTANGPKTRVVWCLNYFDEFSVAETASHPGFCTPCRDGKKKR